MKVYINRQVVRGPWGGGNMFVKAYREMGTQGNVEVLDGYSAQAVPDVALLVGLDREGDEVGVEQAISYKLYMNPSCKLVLRVNENDARKGTSHLDDALIQVSQFMDGTVFVSRWLQDYFNAKGWACANQAVIINGVDRDVFKPGPKPSDGKLHIVAHHWSDNRMKGADIYEEIDRLVGEQPDKFAFTYIGRHKCDFKHTTVVRPLAGKALGEELGRHDVYVSASRFDPGPNHILEALACGLPTYVHKDGGGCVEFAGRNSTYKDWDELRDVLMSCVGLAWASGWPKPGYQGVRLSSWQTCVQEYNRFLEATWQATNPDSSSC